jgi:deoxyadenosine/deoxycytidine kinase
MSNELTIVCIEGNIGSGKSTLLTGLQIHGFKALLEPLDEWDTYRTNEGSLLELLYKDPRRYAFTFQMMCLWTRAKALKEAIDECIHDGTRVLIVERSLLTSSKVFVRVMVSNGVISPMEFRLYHEIYDSLQHGLQNLKYNTIYINTEPEVCLRRIRGRSRSGEQGITYEYIHQLYRRHEEWMSYINPYEIDGAADPETVLICALNYLRAIV